MYGNRHDSKHPKEKSNKSHKSKKEKRLAKLIASDSDTDAESEHELSHYLNDRVKLMKEVLKIMKPKKIKAMAPDCMKHMDLQEVNSMLLEELLGISNKRLKYIFDGKVLEEDSSTDDDQSVDVISLDDISDDDFVVISDEEDNSRQKSKCKRRKVKTEPREKPKKVKKEKPDKERTKEIQNIKEKIGRGEKPNHEEKKTIGEENLMSVLELLELQARARAIRSQLELENKRKEEEKRKLEEEREKNGENNLEPDDDEIIMEIPKDIEIVITSSESDVEEVSEKIDNPNKDTQKKIISQGNNDDDTQNGTVHMDNEQINASPKGSADAQKEDTLQTSDMIKNLINVVSNDKSSQGKNQSQADDSSALNKQQDVPKIWDKEEGELTDDGDSHLSDSNSTSSNSNDNLQMIKERELRKNESHHSKRKNSKKHSKRKNITKLDAAVANFMKTQPAPPAPPPPPEDSEKLKKREELAKEEKINQDKEKRLRSVKNKLESFKQDVAVETTVGTSTVTVLEDIIVRLPVKSKQSVEESDDLVINVDQDDIDCMICD